MSTYIILDLIYYVFISTISIPIIIGICRVGAPGITRSILLFLVTWAIIEIVAIVLRYSQVRNHFLYYFHMLNTLLLAFTTFSRKTGRRIIINVILFIIAVFPIEVLYIGFNRINTITLSLSRIMVSVAAIIELKHIMVAKPMDRLSENPQLYLYTGLLILAFFSLLTTIFKSTFIETSLSLYYFFDTLAVITNAVGFIAIARGFWLLNSLKVQKY